MPLSRGKLSLMKVSLSTSLRHNCEWKKNETFHFKSYPLFAATCRRVHCRANYKVFKNWWQNREWAVLFRWWWLPGSLCCVCASSKLPGASDARHSWLIRCWQILCFFFANATLLSREVKRIIKKQTINQLSQIEYNSDQSSDTQNWRYYVCESRPCLAHNRFRKRKKNSR